MNRVYVCDFVRTPIGRYAGGLARLRTDDLAALTISELLTRQPGIAPEIVDEVILGCANQAGEDNRNIARMASLLAGLPDTVPGITVNRLCASGLDAVAYAARQIACGEAEIVIAGGVESMSRAPLVMPKPDSAFSRRAEVYDTTIGWRFINPRMAQRYGTDSMPETAENVARSHGISRDDQDACALRSQQRVARARARGFFAGELMTVRVPGQRGGETECSEDEHPREDSSAETLAALPALFADPGTVTAGNSAGINDGACALLVASEAAVLRLGMSPLARIVASASAGVEPRFMGMGPVPAARRLLERTGVTLAQLDVIELNEAFAAQALAVLRELGIHDEEDHVNPNGGAIALGHPLGMSGARIVGTAARHLGLIGGRHALCAMCVGVGQGVAMLLEHPG